jgi:tripartite-type tricarboxylate transporter receptor subunit TctC
MPITNAVYRMMVLTVLAGPVWLPAASAQSYPTKPIRIVVPFPQGRRIGSRRGGWCWGGDGAQPPGLWHCIQRWLAIAMLAATSTFAMPALAQNYPAKPIRIVVPFPPGGTADVVVRTLAQPLGSALGQSVIVDNRSGGNTVIATEIVARAPADGYTLLITGFPFVANAVLRSNLPYDTLKDFAAVARIESSPWMLAAHPSLPVKTIKELIALARTHRGQLTYAANPVGSGAHLIGEMLKLTTKIDIIDVPYQGEVPAMIAVMGGHADILIAHVQPLIPQLAARKLRVLAVTSRERLERFREIPTLAESGMPDFELSGTQGVTAPAATPSAVINRLSTEILRAVALPAVRDNLIKQGLDPAPLRSGEYAALIRAEFLNIQKMVRAAKIKLD